MLVHSVYFWLKPELPAEDKEKFWTLVRRLTTIESVRYGWAGTPAVTADRPIIDKSYSCALVLVFDDESGHDSYQIDPVHDEFRTQCGTYWSKIVIYDAVA